MITTVADGVRGVTAARENVNLEAPGSTPAEYPRPPIGMCSWESSEPPKLADRVRILASLLIVSRLRPLECDGIARDPPKVADQVRLLARASHRLLHRAIETPRECVGRTAVFEAARPGPIPGRGSSINSISRPRSVTDSHTTLRRSETRFNSWRGHRSLGLCDPRSTDDAGARRPGDRLQPGSSGFDSHRRLLESSRPARCRGASGDLRPPMADPTTSRWLRLHRRPGAISYSYESAKYLQNLKHRWKWIMIRRETGVGVSPGVVLLRMIAIFRI